MPLRVKLDNDPKKSIDNTDGTSLEGRIDHDIPDQRYASWGAIPELRDAFYEYAKMPKQRLGKDFFDKLSSPYPSVGDEGIQFRSAAIPPDLKTAFGVNIISGENKAAAFKASHGEWNFDDKMFKRFYIGYYIQMLHYYMILEHRRSAAYFSNEDFWQYSCFKTAAYLAGLWTQYVHDITCGDIYGVICALYR